MNITSYIYVRSLADWSQLVHGAKNRKVIKINKNNYRYVLIKMPVMSPWSQSREKKSLRWSWTAVPVYVYHAVVANVGTCVHTAARRRVRRGYCCSTCSSCFRCPRGTSPRSSTWRPPSDAAPHGSRASTAAGSRCPVWQNFQRKKLTKFHKIFEIFKA